MWDQILNVLENVSDGILALAGVWLGWKLNAQAQRRQNRLDRLAESFDALRQVRDVSANIPPDLNEDELRERIKDQQFRTNLSHRLTRMFGLRDELVPALDTSLVHFVDRRLQPIFQIENGRYEVRPERLVELAPACIELRSIIAEVEKRLTDQYEALHD